MGGIRDKADLEEGAYYIEERTNNLKVSFLGERKIWSTRNRALDIKGAPISMGIRNRSRSLRVISEGKEGSFLS